MLYVYRFYQSYVEREWYFMYGDFEIKAGVFCLVFGLYLLIGISLTKLLLYLGTRF